MVGALNVVVEGVPIAAVCSIEDQNSCRPPPTSLHPILPVLETPLSKIGRFIKRPLFCNI